jgi:hypothetical protein
MKRQEKVDREKRKAPEKSGAGMAKLITDQHDNIGTSAFSKTIRHEDEVFSVP